jgi:probable HAF family extracellular repeat protein
MNRHIYFLILLIISFLICGTAQAIVQYNVTDLGTLGGTESHAYDINDSGTVVGSAYLADGTAHAFVFYGRGLLHDLGTFGGRSSEALGVNDYGQIVGFACAADNYPHAFLSDGSTSKQDLHKAGAYSSYARDINNQGKIVGDSDSSATQAAIFLGNNQITKINCNSPSIAEAVNDNGWLVGFSNYGGRDRPFLFDGVTINYLGSLGGNFGYAYDINNKGQIVGMSADSSNHGRAFMADGAGSLQNLDSLGLGSSALAINNEGTVVGYYFKAVADHAFVYDSTNGMQDLNEMIAPDSGWILNQAQGVNNFGQIVGDGVIGGETHAFLLTPVPEPSMLTLLGISIVELLAYVWRKRR